MRHFFAAWFHGNLTRAHYVLLAVVVGIIVFGVLDHQSADRAVDDFVRSH